MERVREASARLFDTLLLEDRPDAILDSLAQILGETLEVDRSLIYEVSFTRELAIGRTEWLNPAWPGATATKATYPLALFGTAARVAYASRDLLESHIDQPHAAMVDDGSAALLHGQMEIQSLLWCPFAFRDDGFFVLVFNHVRARHAWLADELEFIRSATRHVSMALVKIGLIDERARAEEAVSEAQRRESLAILAGGVAHDFNNLMVGVVANADLLARRVTDQAQPLVRAIREAGQSAASLANQLLAFAGQGQPGHVPVHLPSVVEATVKLVRSSISRIPVQIDVEATALPPIDANLTQLEQVIMNLLVNAAEASHPGGGIRVQITMTDLDARDAERYDQPARPQPGRYVTLIVADDGAGMEPATIARIFDPFFTTKRTGRGLGLSAVLGILRQHGGAIRIDSTPGQGSAFTVLWPASEGKVTEPTRPAPAEEANPGYKVLCVDDEASVARVVAALIGDAGYQPLVAIGGAAGLTTFEAEVQGIDVAIIDLTMPGIGGIELLRRMRVRRPTLPAVLMSGYSATPSVDALDERHTVFLRKPFVADELLAALRSVMPAATR